MLLRVVGQHTVLFATALNELLMLPRSIGIFSCGYTGLLPLESVLTAANSIVKRKGFRNINEKAIKKGMAFVRAQAATIYSI